MNWPEAFERSSDHFASAYIWHDAIGYAFWGFGFRIVVGFVILLFCAVSAEDAQKKRQSE